jgi:hypothetical protein
LFIDIDPVLSSSLSGASQLIALLGYANVKRPSIVAMCPSFNEKERIVRFEVEARDAIGTSVDYVGQNKLPPIVLPKVVLPVAYLCQDRGTAASRPE